MASAQTDLPNGNPPADRVAVVAWVTVETHAKIIQQSKRLKIPVHHVAAAAAEHGLRYEELTPADYRKLADKVARIVQKRDDKDRIQRLLQAEKRSAFRHGMSIALRKRALYSPYATTR
jgi:hypothetical protein